MKKIGEPRPQEVVTSEEAFPELGAAPVKVEKKEEPKVEVTQPSTSGPKRFVNNNKKSDSGPNFVPIEKVDEVVPTPAPLVKAESEKKEHVPVFQRGGGAKEEAPVPEQTEDEKIKFSAGPKKFSSSKAVKPREEEKKSELDVSLKIRILSV
jgi:hypothetical protein